jgi:hypothetical protein
VENSVTWSSIWPGEEDDFAAPLDETQARSGAVGIGQDVGTLDDVGLLGVRWGEIAPAAEEALPDRFVDLGAVKERTAQRRGARLPRLVVLGRAEAAHDDQEVRPPDGIPDERADFFGVVSDDRRPGDVESEIIEPAGQLEGIRVDESGRQELGAYGQDLDLHRRRR